MTKNTTRPSKKKSPGELLREEHLQSQLMQLEQKEAAQNQLISEREDLLRNDFTGLTVSHKCFGEGTICDQDFLTVTVQFRHERKRFGYPQAFISGYLVSEDTALHRCLDRCQEIEAVLNQVKQEISKLNRRIHSAKK